MLTLANHSVPNCLYDFKKICQGYIQLNERFQSYLISDENICAVKHMLKELCHQKVKTAFVLPFGELIRTCIY